MLFFWALALLAYVKLLQGGDWRWGVVLGVSFGLGMLAKYAMIYFLLGIAAAALIDRDARALLRSRALWLAAAIAVALILPNAIWNAQNGFVTLTHVGHNIQGEGATFNPLRGLEFVASQFAVFGPVTFSVLLIVCVRMFKTDIGRADRLMLCFALPTLALVTVTAFVTRANANWAAAAFISANILVAAVLVRYAAWRWIASASRSASPRRSCSSPPTPMRAGCRSRGSPSPTSMRAPWAGARSARRSTSSRARPAPGPSPRSSATWSRRCSITRANRPAGAVMAGERNSEPSFRPDPAADGGGPRSRPFHLVVRIGGALPETLPQRRAAWPPGGAHRPDVVARLFRLQALRPGRCLGRHQPAHRMLMLR